jgi:NAD(P)-dependent dehydrogenase (short-subunit alcohol dehydrogenase family)
VKESNEVAVVSGASGGIGRAIAIALARLGMSLVLVGRDATRLDETAKDVCKSVKDVFILPCVVDLTLDEGGARVAEAVKSRWSGLDVLIHSAGIFRMGPIEKVPLSEFDEIYRTNVRGPYGLTKGLLPLLRSRRGQVVFINSSVGLTSRANISAYSAAEHALRAMANAFREELNPDGVRVVTVYPGRTATPMQEAIHQLEGRQYRPEALIQPEDLASVVVSALTLSRTAEITDIQIRPLGKPQPSK